MTATFGETLHEPAAPRDFAPGDFGDAAAGFVGHAGTLRDQAQLKLRGFADQGKRQVTSSLDGVVLAAREIADKLQDGGFGPIGGYAAQVAEILEGWKARVDDKTVEELIDEGRELVRARPGLAVGAAVVAGFALSRFFKAGQTV